MTVAYSVLTTLDIFKMVIGLNAITDMQPTVLYLDKDYELVIMNYGPNHQVVDLQGSHAQSTFGA